MKKYFVIFVCSLVASLAFCQPSPAPDNAGGMKQVLLNPKGFNTDWRCPPSTGRSFLTFREESQKILVAISGPGKRGSCNNNEVQLTESGATFDGCRDTGITLTFDASDKDVPFKGKSAQCTYALKTR
jgi:hypothetical protein